jgi:hypothetical protein
MLYTEEKKRKDGKNFVNNIVKNRELQRLDHKGQKIAITEYSLDHWWA